jgi:hypothetical protein
VGGGVGTLSQKDKGTVWCGVDVGVDVLGRGKGCDLGWSCSVPLCPLCPLASHVQCLCPWTTTLCWKMEL